MSFCMVLGPLRAQEWYASFDAATEASEELRRPMILVFSGSDWCGPCIKLDREVWQTDVFKAYAKDHYVLYKADFPRKKNNRLPEAVEAGNRALAEKYNPKGHFPLVLALGAKGEVLGRTGYSKGKPKAYIALLNSFLE